MTNQSEKSILNDTLVDVSSLDETFITRQNTGQAWQGRRLKLTQGMTVRVKPNMVILEDARPINFGVPGGGDAYGTSKGLPFQIETKTLTGPQRTTQIHFEQAWVKAGGIYILARSADEAVSRLKKEIARKG
jgi:hypothetical protein